MDKKIKEFYYGVLSIAFAIFALVYLIPEQVKLTVAMTGKVGPRTMPQIASCAMGISGFFVALMAIRNVTDKKIFISKDNLALNWQEVARQILFLIVMIGYIMVLPEIGFVISTAVLVLFLLHYFGSDTMIINILVAILFPLLTYLLFVEVFLVPLPEGWLKL